MPVREDALELEPLATTYATDPRFRVPYDQLLAGDDDAADARPGARPAARGAHASTSGAVAAIFGGADVQTSLTAAAAQANALIADYAARN